MLKHITQLTNSIRRLSFFLCACNSKGLVPCLFSCAGSSLTGQALTLRNGRRHSLLRRHLAVRVLSALVSTGRATGHAHFARLRSNLLRLDTTATRTRQAAASDRHRAKKKNVQPRVTVRIDRRPESVLPFSRVASFSCIRFSPPVDRKTTLLLGVISHCSCLGTAAGCRTTTAPATDTATARSSPAEDGATNPRRRTALDARQMAACWPAGCCRDLACCGGCCFVCAAGLGDRQQSRGVAGGVWCQ